MFGLIVRKILGTKHERDVKRMRPTVVAVNELEPGMEALSDSELRARTEEFRRRLADGEELDDLLPDAFAACREAARRAVQMRTSTSSSWAPWCSIRGRSPRWPPARARRWWRRSPRI